MLRALEAIDAEGLSVADAAARAGLSESRMTHLTTETLGAPPRVWRAWFKLQRAIREAALGTANLTQAAHRALARTNPRKPADRARSPPFFQGFVQILSPRPLSVDLPKNRAFASGGGVRCPHV
ncbi:MAG: helix-turn-helix transcriptional regulator [Myxococcales bacterium]|nr:helix-turn-helix transcriptional regulator [Myxococcales bacterium]